MLQLVKLKRLFTYITEKMNLPSDQMSTSGPYGNLEMTSGLIQYGVPTKDFRFGSSGDT